MQFIPQNIRSLTILLLLVFGSDLVFGQAPPDSSFSYSWSNEDWSRHTKVEYVYNTQGEIEEESQYFRFASIWFNDARDVYTYDPQGYLMEQLHQTGDESSWIDQWRLLYQYDSTGQRTQMTDQSYTGSAWQSEERVRYLYNIDELLSQAIFEVKVGSQWLSDYRQTFEYSTAGDMTQGLGQVWDWFEDDWLNDILNTYSYGAPGQRSSWRKQVWDGSDWVNSRRESYGYTADGQLFDVILDVWLGSTWLEIERQEHQYDLADNPSLLLYQWWEYDDEIWVDEAREVYLYDALGQRLSSISQDIGSGPDEWLNRFRQEWFYPTPSAVEMLRPVEMSLAQNFPNPFNAMTQIKYEIPEQTLVSLDIYDARGRWVNTLVRGSQRPGVYGVSWGGLNAAGEQVPTGLYFGRLIAGKTSRTIKMVVLK